MEQTVQNLDPAIQLLFIMASFAILPLMVVSMTSFLRFVIVFSLLRTALGTQQVPPSMVIIGLSLVLTIYTMSPVFNEMYQKGYDAHKEGASLVTALIEGTNPLKHFMLRQTSQEDVAYFVQLNKKRPPTNPDDITLFEVAPAYITSELKTAFEIGFIIFIPFIVLDLVIANILLALGMMMLSPTIISLPFKLLLFVAVDGWALIVHGMVKSFN